MTAVRSRWSRLPGGARIAIALVAIVVALNLGLALVDSATRGADESGPRSSSFSTGREGTAGYAELLRRYGHDVTRLRGSLRARDLDPASTVVVLDASPDGGEAGAVSDFVRRGGRLVAGGADATAWVRDLRIRPRPRWVPGGATRAEARVDGEQYALRTASEGQWADGAGLVRQSRPGAGDVLLLADASPLTNDLLDRADNAALALALAGDGRPVAFVEGPHGYGGSSGLAAIPWRWKVALVLGALAVLLTLIAGSRRIGPAEETVRELPPPRRAYVDALGVALARARRPAAAIAPLQAAARDLVATRAGLGPDATEDEVRAAAARAGWSTTEIDALFTPADADDAVVRAGQALARAEREAQ